MSTPLTKRFILRHVSGVGKIDKMSAGDGPSPLVLCGPSGAGKSTLLKKMLEQYKNQFGFSVSHTTRSPRAGEEDGVAYNFVSKPQMEAAIDNDEFIEFATFAGNMYGTSKNAVRCVMEKGLICILDIDVQGVQSMKKTNFNSKYVFVCPPTMEELEVRLKKRGTESEESLRKRLDLAKTDMLYGTEEGNFDLVLVNDNLEEAYSKLEKFLKENYSQLK